MTAPFADAGMSEVLARVCYQLVKIEYKRHPNPATATGPIVIGMLQQRLGRGTLPWIDTHLLAAAVALQSGTPLRVWRDSICQRSRAGLGWRACVFAGYKAGRRNDPRITNRGVMGLRSKQEVFNDEH